MNEVKRKATSKYFEQEIWNNLSKQNSFEDRRLNLRCHKLEKDESITVRSLNQEQLVMLRRNKKLHDLMDMNYSRYLTLPALTPGAPRSRSTTAYTRGNISTGLGLPPNAHSRPRSHSDHSKRDKPSTKQPKRHEEVIFPAVSPTLNIRSSYSAGSQRSSLSDSEITKQSKRSWTRPSTQLHKRDDIKPRLWLVSPNLTISDHQFAGGKHWFVLVKKWIKLIKLTDYNIPIKLSTHSAIQWKVVQTRTWSWYVVPRWTERDKLFI